MTKDSAVMQLITRCGSVQEFVDRFARFATETDILVPVLPHVTVGSAGQFVIRLQDRSAIMQGRCEVTEIRPGPGPAAGPLGRGLMRLRLREMDAPSWGIHLRLIERRLGSQAPQAAADGVVATAQVPETERTEASPVPPPETRVPGASFTLPANPLSDLDAAELASFVDLTLLETEGEPGAQVRRLRPELERARQLARRAGPYVACVLLGSFLATVLFRPGSPRAAAPATSTSDRQAPLAVPAAAPPEPRAEPANPPPPDCSADVTSNPPGAVVFWGHLALGATPVGHAAVPCGTAVVTFRHERYAELSRTLAVDPGQSITVAERLYRPPARLVVRSSPPDAVILLNKHRVGRAPRKVNTLQFEHVRIEASLPGYRAWKKTVYLRERDSTVDVTLVPLRPPKVRPATARSIE